MDRVAVYVLQRFVFWWSDDDAWALGTKGKLTGQDFDDHRLAVEPFRDVSAHFVTRFRGARIQLLAASTVPDSPMNRTAKS